MKVNFRRFPCGPALGGLRRRGRLGFRLARPFWRLAELATRHELIALDFPPSQESRPRWGYGRPSHRRLSSLLERSVDEPARLLGQIASYADDLLAISRHSGEALEPDWASGWLPAMDAAAIYGLIRARRPRTYVEIGSGQSTRFAARAIADGELKTRLVSIDPAPRAEVDEVCDTAVRRPLEASDLGLFDELEPGTWFSSTALIAPFRTPM